MAISPRRAREIARTRQDILNAAARAFANRGLTGATMQDIAREAGYTAASLYSYFASKDEIVAGLFELIHADRDATFTATMPEGLTFRQKLDLLMQRQLELGMRHFDTIRFFHSSGLLTTRPQCEGAQNPLESMAVGFEAFFRANATPEDLSGWDPADAALVYASLTQAFLPRWLRSATGEEGAAKNRNDFPRLLDFFLAGLSGSSPGNRD